MENKIPEIDADMILAEDLRKPYCKRLYRESLPSRKRLIVTLMSFFEKIKEEKAFARR